MARKGYPPEFRRRVVALIEAGRKVAELAAEFGVSEQSIYTWRRQARVDAGLEAGTTSAELSELAGDIAKSWGLASDQAARSPSSTS
jgi:transposase-like protein